MGPFLPWAFGFPKVPRPWALPSHWPHLGSFWAQPGITKDHFVVQPGITNDHFGRNLGLPRFGSNLGPPKIILEAAWDHQGFHVVLSKICFHNCQRSRTRCHRSSMLKTSEVTVQRYRAACRDPACLFCAPFWFCCRWSKKFRTNSQRSSMFIDSIGIQLGLVEILRKCVATPNFLLFEKG
jgi:hypothetical protein